MLNRTTYSIPTGLNWQLLNSELIRSPVCTRLYKIALRPLERVPALAQSRQMNGIRTSRVRVATRTSDEAEVRVSDVAAVEVDDNYVK